MVEILILGSRLIVDKNEVIKDGYVFIRNGIVEDFGEQPPPEDYTYASLVLGGEGRVVAPGLTALASPISYVLRFYRPSMKRRIDLLKALSESERVLLSLAAIYELHLSGITTIIVEGLDYGYVTKIKEKAGGNYGLAFPSCEGSSPNAPEWSIGTLRISDPSCSDSADIIKNENLWINSEGSEVLSLINKSIKDIYSNSNILEKSSNLRKVLGLGNISVKRKNSAEIVIYDVRKPPAMMLDLAPDREVLNIYSSGAKVESVVIGEDVLVDGGEHLYIVEKQFKEIRTLMIKILESL